jgi:hypothetical protein
MNAIYGLFSDHDSARRAVKALREASSRLRFGPDRITVISHEPLEEQGLDLPRQRTTMPWIAALGGVLGGTAGYSLVAFTQRTYPLPTGGMPIVSLWPAGVITYEFTMLGAILTTVITFLIASRLPNYRRRLYDPEISSGKILVGVSDADVNSWSGIEETLHEQGAERVKQYSTV